MDEQRLSIDWLLALFAVGLSAVAGFVSYLQRYKAANGEIVLNPLSIIIDTFIAMFVGLMFFLCAQWLGVGEMGSVLIAGGAAHLGADSLKVLKLIVYEIIRARYGVDAKKTEDEINKQ